MITALLLILAFASAVACHILAKEQKANPVFWGVMGALFGPLAIVAVALFVKPRGEADDSE